MGTIYRNCFVTIAADWGIHISSGFYNQTSEKLLIDEEGTIRIISILSDGLKYTCIWKILGNSEKTHLWQIQNSTLTTRAWEYQERLLSLRILYFIEGQLLLECRKHALAEDEMTRLLG